MPAGRVLATQQARDAASQLLALTGPVKQQVQRILQQGNILADPNRWNGGLAGRWRNDWDQDANHLCQTVAKLDELEHRAHQVIEDIFRAGTGPFDAAELATVHNPGGDVDGGAILKGNEPTRAKQILNGLPAGDRTAFKKLLEDSRSPEEAAYLWKALAAGHSLAQIEQFDAAIHPRGSDPRWLAGHLAPDISGSANRGYPNVSFASYQGQTFGSLDTQGWDVYDQGKPGDCVAASTIIAQASVDPILMYQLTTGGRADGDDSPEAFHSRLQALYIAQYREGQRAEIPWWKSILTNPNSSVYPKVDAGLGEKGENLLANQDLGSTTGSTYEYVGLDNTTDRQNAVSRIEQAVDSGRPVPIDVTSGSGAGHQLVIMARDGDRLAVYNPWGYTTWVTESQFVNNQLGSLTGTGGDGTMQTADGLELPQ